MTENRYRDAFAQALLPAWFCDAEQRFIEVNDALCQLLERTREQLLGRAISEFTHADERHLDEQERVQLLAGKRDSSMREKQLLRPDGSTVWALVATRIVRGAGGAAAYFAGQASDVSEHHLREQRLRHLADHDALTGLVNRRGFGRELRRHLSRSQRYGARGALLMLDLDNFKGYNDTQGHAGGDELLQTVARTLDARLRAGDVVGRIGGDEFAVLLPEATAAQAEVVAAALVQSVRELGGGDAPRVTASVGIFCFDEAELQSLSEHHAMVGADLAMYAAKHAGRDRHATPPTWTSAHSAAS